MIPLLCHPQSRTAHSTHSLSVSPLSFSLEHVHIDVFDRCVSRCLCGQGREVAAVSEGSAGFLSFQVQEGATVLAYRSHLSAKKKGFVVLNRTRSVLNSQLFTSLEFTFPFNCSSLLLVTQGVFIIFLFCGILTAAGLVIHAGRDRLTLKRVLTR